MLGELFDTDIGDGLLIDNDRECCRVCDTTGIESGMMNDYNDRTTARTLTLIQFMLQLALELYSITSLC